jgi:prophage regulatory protein
MTIQIIRRPAVRARTGLSDSSIDRREREGAFPRRRRIGPGAVGWIAAEIDEWIASRPPVVRPRKSSTSP